EDNHRYTPPWQPLAFPPAQDRCFPLLHPLATPEPRRWHSKSICSSCGFPSDYESAEIVPQSARGGREKDESGLLYAERHGFGGANNYFLSDLRLGQVDVRTNRDDARVATGKFQCRFVVLQIDRLDPSGHLHGVGRYHPGFIADRGECDD